MEEKWWSKFQKKNEGTVNPETSTPETFEKAVNFIDDLNEKIDNSLAEDKVNTFVSDVKSGINDFVNAQELSAAADRAHEIMQSIRDEVNTWHEEVKTEETVEETVEEVKNDNPIMEDLGSVKDAVNGVLNNENVQEAINTVKSGATELQDKAKDVWNSPEVQSKYVFVKDKVEEQLSRDEVQSAINYAKEKAEDAKKWAYDVYNREDVQEGVETIKETANKLYSETKEGFSSFINNPKVTGGYVDAKNSTKNVVNTAYGSINNTINEARSNENLKQELNAWKDSAIDFTKQSGRVIAATAIEIKNNEQVQEFAALVKDAAIKSLSSATSWVARKIGGVEYLDRHHDDKED